MAWQIELSDSAIKALKKIDPEAARRITRFLRERIAPSDDPRQHGKALQGQWRQYWRFRVGSYRLVCRIENKQVRVLVVRIAHRKEIYR